ncbi:hypothetical protein L915_01891 [Phytophthora nicotianae]|uniref:Uncharacterized protein n=1 Tax=Phytophthora nicotianae TaxID=4792 RepID=W2HIS2_PHYNI|nr:hypothetical protein L915_01891 [Phytophthora nicotianae]
MQLRTNLSQVKSAKDNSSCGVWCLVVLELLLFGAAGATSGTTPSMMCWTTCVFATCTMWKL